MDAADEANVSLRALFRNEAWAWHRVSDAFDRRRVNRESVGLAHDRTGRQGNSSERAAEAAARAELLKRVNAPAFARIAADEAATTASIAAQNALLRTTLAVNEAA